MSDTSLPTDEMQSDADLSGRKLGDYQLLRRLGRGGMAVVYLAEQVSRVGVTIEAAVNQ